MASKFHGVAEPDVGHPTACDYEYEHRFAEHEHETSSSSIFRIPRSHCFSQLQVATDLSLRINFSRRVRVAL